MNHATIQFATAVLADHGHTFQPLEPCILMRARYLVSGVVMSADEVLELVVAICAGEPS